MRTSNRSDCRHCSRKCRRNHSRTAVYGPVCTVVWQGSVGDRRPYADQTAFSESGRSRPPLYEKPALRKERDGDAWNPRPPAAKGFSGSVRDLPERDGDVQAAEGCLFQFRVLAFSLLQYGDVLIGLFPDGEKILISGPCFR